MTDQIIDDPISFFSRLGGLHDARIDKITIDVDEERVELAVNDLNANFVVTPGYSADSKPVNLIFHEVISFYLDVETYEGIRVSDIAVVKDDSGWNVGIDLNLGGGEQSKGRRSVMVKFKSLVLQDRSIATKNS